MKMMDEQERQAAAETRTCAECNEPFTITKGEKAFYESKGLLLPKRCQKCRLARRASVKTTMQIPLEPNE